MEEKEIRQENAGNNKKGKKKEISPKQRKYERNFKKDKS